ncbi:MAG: histidinol-phosphate aminotransferase [Paracoccaceae bacterium]|jgi:histidinol-phosphate aminotransferase
MTSLITPKSGILEIRIYESGKSQIVGMENSLKLSSNENPRGPSDLAKEAVARSVHELHRYPSSDHASLRLAIGHVHGLPADQIICGAGSDEIFTFLCQAFSGPGDEVLYTEHGFLMYRISALAAGATPVEVKERNRIIDVKALLKGMTVRTKLVFIANPSNPTGTMISLQDIARLADEMPKQAILVLDGAYAEYVEDYDGGAAWIAARDNIFMTRSFSKIYGLGGLRIGWGYGPRAIIDSLNRVRGPFNLSATQLVAAEAALLDQDFVAKCRTENAKNRAWLAQSLAEMEIASDPSFANFILARFETAQMAEACDSFLQSKGILLRRVTSYKLPNCLRITIGDEVECRRVLQAIAQFKGVNI